MKLADLKQGMVCELRNGEEIIIIGNGDYVRQFNNLVVSLKVFTESLKHNGVSDFDIMKVSYGDKVLFEREEKVKWFVPEIGEKYYFLKHYGDVGLFINNKDKTDDSIIKNQRVFKTKDEAEKRLKQQQATLSVERWIVENDVKVDVYDTDKTKYYIVYDIERKELRVDYYNHYITAPKQFILSSGKKAEELIKEREKELKIMFGVEE